MIKDNDGPIEDSSYSSFISEFIVDTRYEVSDIKKLLLKFNKDLKKIKRLIKKLTEELTIKKN